MKISFYHRVLVLLVLLITAILSSCRCHVEEPVPLAYNYMNVPQGDTAIVQDLNIAGMGARKNNPNTTWIIRGDVTIDQLHVKGHVIVDKEASLTVLKTLYVEEDGTLTVNNLLKYKTLKQSGKVYFNKAAH